MRPKKHFTQKSIFSILLLLFINNFYCQTSQGGIFQFPDGSFAAAIKSLDFTEATFDQDKQRQNMWCWAACVAMALRFQKLNVTQEDVVNKAFNRLINNPGNSMDMVKGASGWQQDGKNIKAWAELSRKPKIIIDDLAYKYPLVIGLNNPGQSIGHAYLLTAIYFTSDKNHNIYPTMVTLRDPWPDAESRVQMSWNEFIDRVNTIVHITF